MLNYYLIGKRVKEVRNMRKISQAELAELADLSVSYINYIENAKRKASLQTLVIIADVMEITVDILLVGNQNNGCGDYENDLLRLMEDCSNYEKRIIYEQVISLKASLRDNRFLLNSKSTMPFIGNEYYPPGR